MQGMGSLPSIANAVAPGSMLRIKNSLIKKEEEQKRNEKKKTDYII